MDFMLKELLKKYSKYWYILEAGFKTYANFLLNKCEAILELDTYGMLKDFYASHAHTHTTKAKQNGGHKTNNYWIYGIAIKKAAAFLTQKACWAKSYKM